MALKALAATPQTTPDNPAGANLSPRYLRPLTACKVMGISQSHFWELAKNDPKFPKIHKFGKRISVVKESDLIAYIEGEAV